MGFLLYSYAAKFEGKGTALTGIKKTPGHAYGRAGAGNTALSFCTAPGFSFYAKTFGFI